MKVYFYLILVMAVMASCSKNNAPTPEPPKPVDPVVVVTTPTVTGFTPASAEIGQQLTVTGTNFGTDINAVKVYFADGAAVIPKSVSATQIIVEVPATAISGQIGVSVNNGAQIKTGGVFSFIPPKATMTGFAPLSAKVNEEITITGTNFGTDINKVSIQFSNGSTIKPKSVTPTQIKLNLTSAASSGILTVIVDGTILKSANLFTYVETEGIDYTTISLYSDAGTVGYKLVDFPSKTISYTGFGNAGGGVIETKLTTGGLVSFKMTGIEDATIRNLGDALEIIYKSGSAPKVEYLTKDISGKITKRVLAVIDPRYSSFVQGPTLDAFKGNTYTSIQVMNMIQGTGHEVTVLQIR